GLVIELVNDTDQSAILSGIEVLALNPLGQTAPAVNLQLSADGGGHWGPLASGLALDRFGRGSFTWHIPANQPAGNHYLRRVVATGATNVAGVSAAPFLITNNGHDYYISTTGNNANSGKAPDQPMADLAALLDAYDLGTGDVVHVAAGTYTLHRNLVLTARDS